MVALEVAGTWYLDRQYEIRHGALKVGAGRRFEAVSASMLSRMKSEGRSTEYRKVLTNYLRAGGYVHRFFGEMSVRKITTRTWDDFRLWLVQLRVTEGKEALSERTVHQLKNSVRLVLKQAYVERQIDDVPRFVDPLRSQKRDHRPRVYFDVPEYRQLLAISRCNIANHMQAKTRWRSDAEELHDYIIFIVNTGLRVSEAKALRICDVSLRQTRVFGLADVHEVCQVTVTGGKRGAHPSAQSFPAAAVAYRRILKRRSISKPASCIDKLFNRHHREAFKRMLRENCLYSDAYGRKRDFVSLRHSHICFRLLSGEPLLAIAYSTRTSALMIENHYARSLVWTADKLETDVWFAT